MPSPNLSITLHSSRLDCEDLRKRCLPLRSPQYCSKLPGNQWEEGNCAWHPEELPILVLMEGLRVDLLCKEDKSPDDGQQSSPNPTQRTPCRVGKEDKVLGWNSSKVNLVPALTLAWKERKITLCFFYKSLKYIILEKEFQVLFIPSMPVPFCKEGE